MTQLAFAPGERLLASGSDERDVLLWSLSEGLKPVGICPLNGPVAELAFSFDGALLAAADQTGHVRMWAPAKEAA